ncbi:hypothetical protein ACTGJ9_013735 [Bradyrhizobium sp. RDM12]
MSTTDQAVIRAACEALVSRYIEELRARGYAAACEQQHVVIAEKIQSAASYMGKGTNSKNAIDNRKQHRSLQPFEIAELAANGDTMMRALWMEYAETMPGTRSCVITSAIAKALKLQRDDVSDEKEPDDHSHHHGSEEIGKLDAPVWNRLLRDGYVPDLFQRVEDGVRWSSLMNWLEAVAPTPSVRADDIPTDGGDVETSSHQAWRGGPRGSRELAREMVVQAATTIPAQRFIRSRIETLARDHVKYGEPPPPGVGDVVLSLCEEAMATSCPRVSENIQRKFTPESLGAPSHSFTIPERLTVLTTAFLALAVFAFVYVRLAPIRSILTATETAAGEACCYLLCCLLRASV